MRRLKHLVLGVLIGCMLVSMTAFADTPAAVDNSTTPEAGTYQDVMSCAVASYLITAQPNDAIALSTNTVLDSDDLGKGQGGIYYNLPRLKNAYYYKLVQETAKWSLTESMYPAIYLPAGITSPAGYECTLQIVHITSGSVVASVKLQMLEQLQGANFTVYNPDVSTISSDNVLALNTETKYYNPILHTCALVCPNAIYIYRQPASSEIWLNTTLKYDPESQSFDTIVAGTVDLAQYEKTDAVKTAPYYNATVKMDLSNFLVRPYCMSSEGGLAYFKTDKYNPITGELLSGASNVGYILASDNELVIGTQTQTEPTDSDTISVALKTNSYYTYADLTAGYLTKIPDANFKYYEKQNRYYMYTTTDLDNATMLAPSFYVLKSRVSWAATGSDMTPGAQPVDSTTYTLRYTYTSGLSSSYINVTPGVAPTLGTPTRSGYRFDGWYVDEALTTVYDWQTFNYVLGASYNLYPKWTITGNYNVRFYDDKNGTDTTKQFSVDELPTLPDNPTYTGYMFKNWLIVDTIASTTGTVYDGNTFKPTANKTYIFKANYDLQGVILSVTPTKTSYWVGDEVDKSELVVLVQTDNEGTTKTLAVSEFSVTPNKIEKSGDNTITVIYTATGATATVHLQGTADYITGIAASYTGDDLYVGDVIPTSKISCKLTYKSGKTVNTTDFSISPSTIKTAGSNTITVTASGYTTSITVNGLRKTTDSTKTGELTLTGISASYTGTQLYVGDNIAAADIKVTAKYSDGSTSVLSSTEFNFSPSFVKNSGSNTITVSYKDKTAIVNISALEKSSMNNTGISSTKPTAGVGTTGTTTTGNRTGTSTPSTTGTGVTSGVAVTSADGKGTSSGYLSGKNILDPYGGGDSTVAITNDVDILTEIESAGAKATSVDITLINTAEGNYLTPDMVGALIDKGLILNVTMVSPSDKQTQVGYWSFNGKSMDEMSDVIDLNFSYSQIDKEMEKMYTIGISPATYGAGITCTATMPGAYVNGTFVNLYKADYAYGSSEFLSNMLWNSSDSVDLPITQGYIFVLSDLTTPYEDGSDLTLDVSRDDVIDEEETEEEATEEEEEEFDFSLDEEEESEEPLTLSTGNKSKRIILTIVMLLVVLAAFGGMGIVAYKVLSNRSTDEFDEDDEDEEIIDDEDEYLEDESYDEVEEYDDMEDE